MRCVACKQEIEDGAAKCHHCDSQQGWHRHLSFSTTVLSLLVALISVSGIVIPLVVKTFQQPSSEVSVALLDTGPLSFGGERLIEGSEDIIYTDPGIELKLLITNVGDRPGLIVSANVTLHASGSAIAEGPLFIGEDDAIVEVSDYRVMRVFPSLRSLNEEQFPAEYRAVNNELPLPLDVSGGELKVRILRHDGTERWQVVQLPPGKISFHN